MALSERYPVIRDVVERVLATFVMTMLALATADGVDWTEWTDWGHWKTWAISALAAAFSLLKSLIATRVGRNPSASLDPAVKLQPTAVAPRGPHAPGID